jgi:hypothetical protein
MNKSYDYIFHRVVLMRPLCHDDLMLYQYSLENMFESYAYREAFSSLPRSEVVGE